MPIGASLENLQSDQEPSRKISIEIGLVAKEYIKSASFGQSRNKSLY